MAYTKIFLFTFATSAVTVSSKSDSQVRFSSFRFNRATWSCRLLISFAFLSHSPLYLLSWISAWSSRLYSDAVIWNILDKTKTKKSNKLATLSIKFLIWKTTSINWPKNYSLRVSIIKKRNFVFFLSFVGFGGTGWWWWCVWCVWCDRCVWVEYRFFSVRLNVHTRRDTRLVFFFFFCHCNFWHEYFYQSIRTKNT